MLYSSSTSYTHRTVTQNHLLDKHALTNCETVSLCTRKRWSHQRQPVLLWYTIKRGSVFQAGTKNLVNCQSASQSLARRIHGQGQLSTPPDAHLMLFPDAVIASQQFLLKVAISTQTCCSDLAACMMLAVVPIHIGCSAMVICVQQLMGESMVHLLLTQQMIVAQYDLQYNVSVSYQPVDTKVTASNMLSCLTPSGGLNPPPAWAEQFSTLKKFFFTSQPACIWDDHLHCENVTY